MKGDTNVHKMSEKIVFSIVFLPFRFRSSCTSMFPGNRCAVVFVDGRFVIYNLISRRCKLRTNQTQAELVSQNLERYKTDVILLD